MFESLTEDRSAGTFSGGPARIILASTVPTYGCCRRQTWPVLPLMVMVDEGMRTVVALGTASTAGIPASLATIAALEQSTPPVSVTTADAMVNSGVHAGSVLRQTSTSPGWTSGMSAGPRTSRTGPEAIPGLAGSPVMVALLAGGCGGAVESGRDAVTGRA